MSDVKTFDSSLRSMDPLISKQKEDVAKMRTSLLACSDDLANTAVALRNITVLRVFHQISRIIRYLEMMDKIEEKLYASIESHLERMDEDNPSTWMQLLRVQEQLQTTMINSHKLLQPYLNIQEFGIMDLTVDSSSGDSRPDNMILSRESRDRLRTSAQAVLAELDVVDSKEMESDE